MTFEEREEFLSDAASRPDSNPVRITIREFVDKWDVSRRGHRVVLNVRRDLKRHGLRTVPDFASGWIDNTITLLPMKSPDDAALVDVGGSVTADADETVSAPEVALRIGSLQSATGDLCSVAMDTSLETAQSYMMRHDYSQLAVMSGTRDLRGAVTWESIAQARLRNENATLRDAIVPAPLVGEQESLLDRVPLIIESSFVFVHGDDNAIVGIVTTADLSAQFVALANPFFLLGEIERRLRLLLDQVFSRDELAQMVDPADVARNVSTVDDLTMGEYIRILENPKYWGRIGLPVDRRIFVDALNQVREIRNDVMHFSPDPLEPSQVDELQNFLRWLRTLRPDTHAL